MNPKDPNALGQRKDMSELREMAARIEALQAELEEKTLTLEAIQNGEVDAIVVSTESGEQIFTLEGAEAPYRILFEQMNEGAATMTEDGEIGYCNQSFARAMNTSLEKMIGANLFSFVHPSDSERFSGMVQQSKISPVRDDIMFKAKDGSRVLMQLSINFMATAKIPIFCIVTSDLSERIRMEESLRAANAELDIKVQERTSALAHSNAELQQFAYIASHDLQEPLRMVISYLTLLERRYGDKLDTDAQEYIQFAVDGGKRMKELIDDLLRYSKVDTQGDRFVMVDMNNVVLRVLDILGISIEENKANILLDPLPPIRADEQQMVQLMQNLISNAIKFRGPEPLKIHISATPGSGESDLFSEGQRRRAEHAIRRAHIPDVPASAPQGQGGGHGHRPGHR